jgi:prepilin-type N-terminal cleavage/methylation domain-containing protein
VTSVSRQYQLRRLADQPRRGFTLVEVLVSAVILVVGLITIIQVSNITITGMRSAAARTEVDGLVSRDLNWLSWYAKAWNCTAGSYATCTAQSQSGILRYSVAQACSSLAANFLTAASAVAVGAGVPPKPFPVPAAAGDAQVLQSVEGVNLTRTIALSASPRPERLEVAYTYPGPPVIQRSSSVLIQAGGWCQP